MAADERIVGICRFSFLGRGDWIGMRGKDAVQPDILSRHAQMLYAPARLARRFAAFEALFLPSIAAQTDPDFQLWILTSPELPAVWLARLRDLCAPVRQIRIVVSDVRGTSAALSPLLARAAADAGGPVMQFRIDDDDALSRHYVARLRRHARRFRAEAGIAISLASGLILRSYHGEPFSYWSVVQRFGSAGAAARFPVPSTPIFTHNHFDLSRYLNAFIDLAGVNYLQLRWDESDSATPAQQNWDRQNFELGRDDFERTIADDFPHLRDADLGFVGARQR